MRSWRSALVLGIVVAACGANDDISYQCQTSFLTYDNFGAPFMSNWCRGCHSTELPPGTRQGAPSDMNFDTIDDVHMWSHEIQTSSGTGIEMPPNGGPSQTERDMLVEWLSCGAR